MVCRKRPFLCFLCRLLLQTDDTQVPKPPLQGARLAATGLIACVRRTFRDFRLRWDSIRATKAFPAQSVVYWLALPTRQLKAQEGCPLTKQHPRYDPSTEEGPSESPCRRYDLIQSIRIARLSAVFHLRLSE
ncbi:hypothetical protein B0J18DRAFT_247630 [Chaetomium sp. MPI-SDFR-AT-0129]|nr:hypothetical protein B0J18DRAFT_247630 [Chaetomium sp. MPI-SDFR-AT-0129]